MKILFRLLSLVIWKCLIFSQIVFAQSPIESKQVNFKKGVFSTVIEDSLSGYRSIDYTLQASRGQLMSINLQTNNLFNYFNVLPPQSESALFIGSTSGNDWSDVLPETGEYLIRVYLMRNAARRKEKATYKLRIEIKGNASMNLDTKVQNTPYHATGEVPCFIGDDKASECAFGVIRKGIGHAEVHVSKPNGTKRIIMFYGDDVKLFDKNIKLKTSKGNDNWYINIDGTEFYTIPDAVINGG